MSPKQKQSVEDRYGGVVLCCNSKSQPDKVYNVRMKNGLLSCNCKGWIFNREIPKRCKHTDKAREVEADFGRAITQVMTVQDVLPKKLLPKSLEEQILERLGKELVVLEVTIDRYRAKMLQIIRECVQMNGIECRPIEQALPNFDPMVEGVRLITFDD